MRVHILALAAFSVTSLSHAASIEKIETGVDRVRSIETIACDGCVAETRKEAEPALTLAPGTQKIELKTVDGVTKVYRTEAWLGGSPVVFVSTASDALIARINGKDSEKDVAAKEIDKAPEEPATVQADMIDESATTAAVTADMGAEARIAPEQAAFDAGNLELRLN